MQKKHYENFPVASLLLPKYLHFPVNAIYAFARTADDIADEGDANAEERSDELTKMEQSLNRGYYAPESDLILFEDLQNAIRQFNLPLTPFLELLTAFKQDTAKTRYEDFSTLLNYCALSANPVGNLILHLYREASEDNLRDSNQICSALQIINFIQDVGIDWQKNRIYLPQTDLLNFKITENHIENAIVDKQWIDMMRHQTNRAREMMLSGQPLCKRLSGRLGFELRMVVQGGLRILEKIDAVNGDIFRHRPKLNKWDYVVMGIRACTM